MTLPPPTESPVVPGVWINGELHFQWRGPGVNDPCASLRAQVTALTNQLNELYSGIPANKAENSAIAEAAERRLEQWHRQHDEELASLKQRLANCDNLKLPNSTAIAVSTGKEETTPEKSLDKLIRSLSATQQKHLADFMKIPNTGNDRHTLVPARAKYTVATVAHLPKNIRKAERRLVFVPAGAAEAQQQRRLREFMCKEAGNRMTEFPCP